MFSSALFDSPESNRRRASIDTTAFEWCILCSVHTKPLCRSRGTVGLHCRGAGFSFHDFEQRVGRPLDHPHYSHLSADEMPAHAHQLLRCRYLNSTNSDSWPQLPATILKVASTCMLPLDTRVLLWHASGCGSRFGVRSILENACNNNKHADNVHRIHPTTRP